MTPNELPEEQSHPTHKDSGERCRSYHQDHKCCVKCALCGEWIRPEDMAGECRGYDPVKGAMA
jgi:hypothetical protein